MIEVDDKGDFTLTIFDLIKELKKLEKFALKVWVNGSELAFLFDDSWDILFIQESIKIMKDGRITYIPLDSVASVTVYENRSVQDVAL